MNKKDTKLVSQALNDPNFSFIESFSDAGDTVKVTKEMTALLFRHRRGRTELKKRERNLVRLESEYKAAKNKSYFSHKNAKNESEKRILVEIDTEEEAYRISVEEQKIKEIRRELSGIKLEIDTLKAISYSLRTEMGSF